MIEHIDIIKKSKAYKIINQDAVSDRIAHSYMVISEDKETSDNFISCMLQTIYCKSHNACGICAECTRLEHDNNPNVYKLKKDSAIKVDDIKDYQPLKQFELGRFHRHVSPQEYLLF